MPDVLVSRSIFKPNLVETPSATPISALASGNVDALTFTGMRPQALPQSTQGVRLQIRTVQVMDGLQGFAGLNIGKAAGVYLITSVVDGLSNDPIVFQGRSYSDINNGDKLPIGPNNDPNGVFNVYLRQSQIPQVLSFSILILRSNKNLRDAGALVSRVMEDNRYQTLSGIVKTAVQAANPAYGLVWQVAEEAIGLFAEYLSATADEELSYYQANYTNLFDNLGVGPHPSDRPTMPVAKVRLGYQIDAV